MVKKFKIPLICCIYLFYSCKAQSPSPSKTANKAEPSIYGEVHDSQTKDLISGAVVIVKGTVFGSRSSTSGQYSINVSAIADTTTTYHLFCSSVSYSYSNIIIKGKITKPVKIDIDMVNGEGSYTKEYRVNPKSGKLEVVSP